jgi:hypothetical protein
MLPHVTTDRWTRRAKMRLVAWLGAARIALITEI